MRLFLFSILTALLVFGMVGCAPPEETEPEAVEEAPVEEEIAEEEETPEEEKADEIFEVGDTVAMGDLEFTLKGARWEHGDEFTGPDEGERWLVVDCDIENKGEESEHLSSMGMFSLYDEENYKCDEAIMADTRGNIGGELGAGRSMSGELAFTVLEEHSKWELIFEPNAFGFGQAIFEIEEGDVE